MLLNFEKFSNYADKFNHYLGLVKGVIDKYFDTGVGCYLSEELIKELIHEYFPQDWIVYGKYSTSIDINSSLNYYRVCDLTMHSLRDLQTHINNIEAMCDNSYQTLQDFDQFDISGL